MCKIFVVYHCISTENCNSVKVPLFKFSKLNFVKIIQLYFRKAARKVIFLAVTTKALTPPPPLSLVVNFISPFFLSRNKLFFLSGPTSKILLLEVDFKVFELADIFYFIIIYYEIYKSKIWQLNATFLIDCK